MELDLRANVGNTHGVWTQCEGVVVAELNACRQSTLPVILVEADSAGKKTQSLVCPLSMVSFAPAPQLPPSGPVSKELSFDILFVCYFISFPLQYGDSRVTMNIDIFAIICDICRYTNCIDIYRLNV